MAAVEFAILGSVLCLFIGGIIDFGHAFYMKQVITNAAREGTRYAVAYRKNTNPNSVERTVPSQAAISAFVKTDANGPKLSQTLPASTNPTVTAAGTGLSTKKKGDPVEVTVTATKNWCIVATFVPCMSATTDLSSTTVMQLE